MTVFEWDDYLRLATRLASEEDEAARRTAISRAYYFVFHLAQQRARDNGCEKIHRHGELWKCYIDSASEDCKQIGLDGQRLHEKRKNADYNLPFKGRLGDEVQDSLRKASNFSNRLIALDPAQPSSSFK